MNKIRHIIKLGWSYRVVRSTCLSYPPFQHTIEPTNICNLSCSFCLQSDPGHHQLRPHGKLTVDHLRLFLNRVKEAAPGDDKINLTLDGEPFFKPGHGDFYRNDFKSRIRCRIRLQQNIA